MKRSLNLFLAIALVAFGCTLYGERERQIVFAPKSFSDSARTTGDEYVYVVGTLTGNGITYKNNTMAVACYRDRMECLTYSVEQRPNQVGSFTTTLRYPVTKWAANEIIATEDTTITDCRKTTITIERESETVLWVEETINQSRARCKDAQTSLLK
jgi:hypothetical protein